MSKTVKKKKKDIGAVIKSKPLKEIREYYYFLKQETNARQLMESAGQEFADAADIWTELDLAEIVMDRDSLIFQNARECFEDPQDLDWFRENGIKAWYEISYDVSDLENVKKAMKNIMTALGGVICSDTDDFQPSWTLENLDKLQ